MKADSRLFFVYIVECDGGSLYTGYTAGDAEAVHKRVAVHNKGKGAKYTRSRRPVRLAYVRQFESYLTAVREERRIKKLNRVQKEALIKNKV